MSCNFIFTSSFLPCVQLNSFTIFCPGLGKSFNHNLLSGAISNKIFLHQTISHQIGHVFIIYLLLTMWSTVFFFQQLLILAAECLSALKDGMVFFTGLSFSHFTVSFPKLIRDCIRWPLYACSIHNHYCFICCDTCKNINTGGSVINLCALMYKVIKYLCNLQCCDPKRHLPYWACACAFSVHEAL